ncbi:MAG: nuclear transport factor 2 family protein [Woeseiaceae bacterium]
MKRVTFLTISLSIFLSQSVAFADSHISDIQEVVQKYLDGTAHGRPELVSEAFLPSLEVQYLDEEDRLMRRNGPDYISRIEPGKKVPRAGRVVNIDATEKSAMVKVEIEWNDRLYTDYMLLLKVEGSWRIANKIATWVEK